MSSFNGHAKSLKSIYSPALFSNSILGAVGIKELYFGFFNKIPLTYKNVSNLTNNTNSFIGKELYKLLINYGEAPQYMKNILQISDKINKYTNNIKNYKLNLSNKYGNRSPYAFVVNSLTSSVFDLLESTKLFGNRDIKKAERY